MWTDTIHLSKSAFKSNSDLEEREQCWCGIVHLWFDRTIAKNQNIDFGQDSCMEDFGCQFDVYRMRPWVNLVTVMHKLRTRVMPFAQSNHWSLLDIHQMHAYGIRLGTSQTQNLIFIFGVKLLSTVSLDILQPT